MVGASLSQTVRAAERLLEQHSHARQAPAVMWAGVDETEAAFAMRCVGRQLNGAHRILAAVPHGFAVPAGVQAVPFAPKLFRLLHPDRPSRYRIGTGGRGSAKSHSFATAIVLRMLSRRSRILAAREIMKSLRESVHHLVSDKIEALGVGQFFEITDREISCVATGSDLIFTGLFANVQTLRSLEGVDLCWLEEGESVTADSLLILTPTIRAPGSEIWISMNPDDPKAPVQQMVNEARPDCRHVHVIFSDNPWFPGVLEADRLQLQSVDPDAYAYVWLGQCRAASDAQVFKGKYAVEAFEPKPDEFEPERQGPRLPRSGNILGTDPWERRRLWQGPYFGADWGFSQDPTTCVRVWISKNVLYVEHEAYAIGCDIDRTPQLFDAIPDARKYAIRADNARPETISYMRQNGYPRVEPCSKWKGSVEDGVAFLRSFERIVVHPRCTHAAEEFRLYSYRVDRLTGDVLPDLVDKHNHMIDAIRYAVEPVIKRRRNARVVPLQI